jgi:hypothetical protein
MTVDGLIAIDCNVPKATEEKLRERQRQREMEMEMERERG